MLRVRNPFSIDGSMNRHRNRGALIMVGLLLLGIALTAFVVVMNLRVPD